MSKENNNNKNFDSSIKEDEFQCDSRPNESDENGASTGEISSSSNNNGQSAKNIYSFYFCDNKCNRIIVLIVSMNINCS